MRPSGPPDDRRWGARPPIGYRSALRASGVVIFFAGLTLVFFLPFLSHPQELLWPASGLGSDVAYINWPLQTYYADQLRTTGGFPLWDSRFMLGLPLVGDPHIMWLYPLDVLLVWLPPALALNLMVMFHVFMAGVAMFALLRRGFHTSYPAAMLAALSFMFMPKFMAQSMGAALAFGLVWVPFVWLGVRLAAVEGHRLAGALGGAALALLTPVHIQITYYAAATAVAYFVWLLAADAWSQLRAGQRLEARYFRSRLMAFAAFLISFGLLAAPFWLPLAEILQYTSRQHFSLASASYFQLPVVLLATLLAPSQFQFPEWIMYLGVVPVALTLAAWLGPRRRETWFFLALTAFALVYALGTQTPLFGLVFFVLPGAGFLRVPTRLWTFAGAAIAVTAGLGLDALPHPNLSTFLQRHAPRLRPLAVAYFGGLCAALATISVLANQFQGQILVVILVAAGLVLSGWAYWTGRLPLRGLQLGFCLFMLADLMPLAQTFFTLDDPRQDFLKSSPALNTIATQPGLFRTYSTHKDLSYAAAAAHGLETLDGSLSFQIDHSLEIIKAATGCELDGFATGVPPCVTAEIDKDAYLHARPDAALLGLLNVKYIVSGFPLGNSEFSPVSQAGDETVYLNQKWLPRAFVVGQVRQVPDQETALAQLRQSDPAQVAFVVDAAVPALAAADPLNPSPANITQRGSGYYQLQAAGPGWLVLSETWLPGWQARLNGAPVHVFRTDYALLGLYLPAGQNTVELEYQPLGWHVGALLMIAGLIALAVWMSWRMLRHANRRQPARTAHK